MFVDPEGKVIGRHEGEFPLEPFDDLIAKMVEEFDAAGVLDRRPRGLEPERLAAPTPLRFPGKVLADAAGGRLFISDTGGNRILGADLDGRVDRKSTRLNSSHSQISYAVFCLKKKKQNHNQLY